MRLHVGQRAPDFTVRDIHGQWVSLMDYSGTKLLLSFYRAAVCPLCVVRTAQLAQRAAVYRHQGLELLAFYESSPARTRQYLDRLRAPFPLVADPRRWWVYTRYGVETSWLGTLRGTLRRNVYRTARRQHLGVWQLLPGFLAMEGAKFRVPADFLIGPD